jgi:hypothetical protein
LKSELTEALQFDELERLSRNAIESPFSVDPHLHIYLGCTGS